MASRRQAAHGTFWGFIERALTQGMSFVVVLVLARLLGPQNYGLVTLAGTVALFGQTLIGETFSQALIQAKTVEPAHISSIFWMLFGAGIVSSAALAALSGILAVALGQPDLAPLLQALSPLLFLTSLQAIPMALFKRDLDFRSIALASASGTILGGAVGIGLAFGGGGVWSLVANLLVQNTVIAAVIWRRADFWPGFSYSHKHFLELWSYGRFTFLLRVAGFTANQGPRLMVGYLFGPAELGAFSLGLRIVEITYQLFTLPVANVAVSVVARVRDDPVRLRKAILGSSQLSAMISAPMFIGLALVAPLAVPLVFGSQWTKSVEIVQILSVYGVAVASNLIWQGIVGGLGRQDANLGITALAAALSVFLLFATSPWGLIGSSIVFVIRGYATLPLFLIWIKRLTDINLVTQFGVLLPATGACLAMSIVIETVMQVLGHGATPIKVLLVALGAGAGTYILGICLFAPAALRLGVSMLLDLRRAPRSARPV